MGTVVAILQRAPENWSALSISPNGSELWSVSYLIGTVIAIPQRQSADLVSLLHFPRQIRIALRLLLRLHSHSDFAERICELVGLLRFLREILIAVGLLPRWRSHGGLAERGREFVQSSPFPSWISIAGGYLDSMPWSSFVRRDESASYLCLSLLSKPLNLPTSTFLAPLSFQRYSLNAPQPPR